MITLEQVKHIAKLARIDLNEQEIKKYQAQLGNILNYVKKLKNINTNGIETVDAGTIDLENIWRIDENTSINIDNNLIDMAPEKYNNQVKVKKIL